MDAPSARATRWLLPGAAALAVAWFLVPRVACFLAATGRIENGRCIGINNRSLRGEILGNLAGIRTAQLAHDAAFEGFVACPEPTPRPVAALSKPSVPWTGGECWDALGWRPDGHVRGTYWVEVSDDGEDFVAHAAIDLDGDRHPATATATRDREPALDTLGEL